MNQDRVFIDPITVFLKYGPCIVLVDDRRSFISFAIKAHTSGQYRHAMILNRHGFFASQTFTGFKEIPIADYMKPYYMLKFWRIKDIKEMEKVIILSNINRRLAVPKWRQMISYDWLGIFGQFLHIPKINNPWQEFCSEQVYHDYLSPIQKIRGLFVPQSSPSKLDSQFKMLPIVSECLGYYWED